MKKKYIVAFFVVLAAVGILNSIINDLPGFVQIVWGAMILTAMLWGALALLFNPKVNAWFMKTLKDTFDYLRK